MDFAEALWIAVGHHRAGRWDDAIAAYHHAMGINPASPEARGNLGVALRAMGRVDEAIEAYRGSLELSPDRPEAWNNLGNALREQGKLDDAMDAYRRALALRPDNPETLSNLAAALASAGMVEEAVAGYQRAVSLAPGGPGSAVLHSNLVYTLHFHPGMDAGAFYQAHRAWNLRHAAPLRTTWREREVDWSPHRRLRIGYVSPDWYEHVVGRFLLPLLAGHDPERFEVFAYCNLQRPPDAMTGRLRAHTDHWRDISRIPDEEAAKMIRADRIDILVDLAMHMADHRLLVFARKPAPVQVTYLAYCGTTGLESIDYRLTDPHLDPPGKTDGIYSEESIHLPTTYWCYQPGWDGAVTPLPASDSGHVTFGFLGNFSKVSAPVLETWCRLLRAVPSSRLLLHALEGKHRQRVGEGMAREGVDPRRLEFVGFLPMDKYFETYQRIDIALDSFPYAGGTTTCDALWMGVPVVTLRGRTGVGRHGVSILTNVGLPHLIAADVDEYVARAVQLAGDMAGLAELRGRLRPMMRQSPLMDGPRFAADMEAAFRRMWNQGTEKSLSRE